MALASLVVATATALAAPGASVSLTVSELNGVTPVALTRTGAAVGRLGRAIQSTPSS